MLAERLRRDAAELNRCIFQINYHNYPTLVYGSELKYEITVGEIMDAMRTVSGLRSDEILRLWIMENGRGSSHGCYSQPAPSSRPRRDEALKIYN
jgi:hypothetical protein